MTEIAMNASQVVEDEADDLRDEALDRDTKAGGVCASLCTACRREETAG